MSEKVINEFAYKRGDVFGSVGHRKQGMGRIRVSRGKGVDVVMLGGGVRTPEGRKGTFVLILLSVVR